MEVICQNVLTGEIKSPDKVVIITVHQPVHLT